MKKEEYVFFVDELGAGGISTNVVALSSHLHSIGIKSIISPLKVKMQKLSNYGINFSEIFSPVKFLFYIFESKNKNYIFFTNSIRTILLAYLIIFLTALKDFKIKIVFCAYNPWEFSASGYWASSYRKFLYTISGDNIFFMNGATYEAHAAVCLGEVIKPIFLPLVIPSVSIYSSKQFHQKRKSVLTVGRFVGFKMHYMRALLKYAQKNPLIDFYFVGYGKGEVELSSFVKKNNLNNIYFLGETEYEKLHTLYTDVDCYVGMGTTLVEASSAGTPSVVAVVSKPGDVSYGLFINQSEYDVGEFRINKPLQSLSDNLNYILTLDSKDYLNLSLQHKIFSKRFNLNEVGMKYIELCKSANFTNANIRTITAWFFLLFSTIVYYFSWRINGRKSRYDIIN